MPRLIVIETPESYSCLTEDEWQEFESGLMARMQAGGILVMPPGVVVKDLEIEDEGGTAAPSPGPAAAPKNELPPHVRELLTGISGRTRRSPVPTPPPEEKITTGNTTGY
jgi:hypothetical protein